MRIGLNAASRKTNDLVFDRAYGVEVDNDELDTGTDSTTDPEAKSVRKGKRKEVELCFGGHALMENRNGLWLDIRVSSAILLKRQCRKGRKPTSLGGDKGYHGKAFIEFLRRKGIRPHIAQIDARKTPELDARTTCHAGYWIRQQKRKRVEEIFGWMKAEGAFSARDFAASPASSCMRTSWMPPTICGAAVGCDRSQDESLLRMVMNLNFRDNCLKSG